jgi:hypothetical protein
MRWPRGGRTAMGMKKRCPDALKPKLEFNACDSDRGGKAGNSDE